MVSARVGWQQGFEKNYSKIRSYPPDSELHVCTVSNYLAFSSFLNEIVSAVDQLRFISDPDPTYQFHSFLV